MHRIDPTKFLALRAAGKNVTKQKKVNRQKAKPFQGTNCIWCVSPQHFSYKSLFSVIKGSVASAEDRTRCAGVPPLILVPSRASFTSPGEPLDPVTALCSESEVQ